MKESAKIMTKYALMECTRGYGVSAQILFSAARKLDPSYMFVHNLGYYYLLQGKCYIVAGKWWIYGKVNYRRAGRLLLRARKLCPESFETLCALGELKEKQHRYSAAIEYMDQAIGIRPLSGYVHWKKAGILFLQKKYAELVNYINMLMGQPVDFDGKEMLFFMICAYAEYNAYGIIKPATLTKIMSFVDGVSLADADDDFVLELLLDAIPVFFVSTKFEYVTKCDTLLKMQGTYSNTIQQMISSSSCGGENLTAPEDIQKEFINYPIANRWYQSLYLAGD